LWTRLELSLYWAGGGVRWLILITHVARMSRPKRLFTGLLVVALAGAGWAYYQAQAQQAATLARITGLENRLISSNKQRAKDAKSTVAGIGVAVYKHHNQSSDMIILQQAKEIQSRTQTLLDTLHQLRQSWQLAGHRTELGRFSAQLDQYVAFLQTYTPDAPLLNHQSGRTEALGWLSEFDTAREPKPAALAMLTKLETQVRQVESEALMNQAQKVGSGCCFCFDRIGAFAIPASETITPGAIYQAQLMLLLGTSTSRAQFSVNGREVPINPATGQASVQFKVPTARPDQPDTVRATWHGRMQMPWADGDTVLETTVPYFIVKPLPR
jgi:hypothetical protein